jgi:hypothetical protein
MTAITGSKSRSDTTVQTEEWHPMGSNANTYTDQSLAVSISDFSPMASLYRLYLFMVAPMCVVIITVSAALPSSDIVQLVNAKKTEISTHQPRCQFLVVVTHKDSLSTSNATALLAELQERLSDAQPLVMVNLKSSKGSKATSDFVLKHIQHNDSLQLLIPRTVSLLDDCVHTDTKYLGRRPFMKWKKWSKYCTQRGASEFSSVADVTRYLEQSGSISWVIRHTDDHSCDWVVLSREWLLDRMLKLPLVESISKGDRVNTIAKSNSEEQSEMQEWHELEAEFQSTLYEHVARLITSCAEVES